MDGKKWYSSKTLWTNALAVAAMATQGITGREIMDQGTQGVILGVINLVLRLFTKNPLAW